MTLSDQYINLLVQQYVQDSLQQGKVLTNLDIENYIQTLEQYDLSVPQFTPDNKTVQHLENASAGKSNLTYQSIRQDLTVLYKEILALSTTAINNNDRWLSEVSHLSKQIKDLGTIVSDLLATTRNNQGYFATITDNFTDTTLVDTAYSTGDIDIQDNYCTLIPIVDNNQPISLNLQPRSDRVSFKTRTQNSNYIGISYNAGTNTDPTTIFDNKNISYQPIVGYGTNPGVVTAELTVRLTDSIVSVSKIQIVTNQSSSLQVTPLMSLDNVNWTQLPGVTTTQPVRGAVTFVFPTVTTKWVKFLLQKIGADTKTAPFNYEFGFQSISFWHNVYPVDTIQTIYSIPLWVENSDGTAEKFSKLSLQTCEQVETGTSINYYITTSNDSTVPVTSGTNWTSISPNQYTSPQYPTIIDLNNTDYYEYSGILLSYNPSGIVSGYNSFRNPASPFYIITSGLSDIEVTTGITTSGQRYHAGNSDNYILNYQIDQSVPIDLHSLEVFRNVGVRGLSTLSGNNTVRGQPLGWSFDGNYYNTVIQIENPGGISITPDSKTGMIIDGVNYTSTIPTSILTGITSTTDGIHSVRVPFDRWAYVPSGLVSSGLALVDPYYPTNGRYLIEGYIYDTEDTSSQVYNTGVSLWAEYYMKEVSPFDMISNIPSDALQFFARDSDIPNSHNGGNLAQTVFVVKANTSYADWINEQYVVSFKLTDQLKQYLRLRVDMQTKTGTTTPVLGGYSIKLGND